VAAKGIAPVTLAEQRGEAALPADCFSETEALGSAAFSRGAGSPERVLFALVRNHRDNRAKVK
jgi:hypothetical protein